MTTVRHDKRRQSIPKQLFTLFNNLGSSTLSRKAKNYTRFMDKYAPSFEIDEEYFQMSLREPMCSEQEKDLKDSLYHTYHKDTSIKEQRPETPPRSPTTPTKPAPLPRTVAQTTETRETTVDGTNVRRDSDVIPRDDDVTPRDEEEQGILYEVDPYPELMYNYGPAALGDIMHSHIKGGTIDALIAEATIYRDTEFVQTIIFTHSTFISTDDLLRKIIKRYDYFADKNDILSKNCIKLFIDVLRNIWMNLTKTMIDVANDFIKMLLNNKRLTDAVELQNTLYAQFQYCTDHKSDLSYSPGVTSISSETLTWTFFLKLKPRDVAYQMTQIDFDKFSKIKLCEILKYVKAPSETTSPNLCAFVNHFNSVSFWASSLVLRRDSKDDRQRVYRRLLSVMEHLIKLNNYSSSFALFAALCKTAVRRVVTLSSKQEKILNSSQELMDSSESYKNLRSALRSAKPPLIPYLGLCIVDLTFLMLGNPDHLEGGYINFTKRYGTYTFMNVVRKSQDVPYKIQRRDDIINFFNNFSDYLEEEAMWQRSEEIKPRKKKS